jgi:hypothetical protein
MILFYSRLFLEMEYTPRINLAVNENTLERERNPELTEEDDNIIKSNNIVWTPSIFNEDAFEPSEDIYMPGVRSMKFNKTTTTIVVNVSISDKNFYFPKGVTVYINKYSTFIPRGRYKNEIVFDERDLKVCEAGGCSIQGGGKRKTRGKRKFKGKRKGKGKRSTRR